MADEQAWVVVPNPPARVDRMAVYFDRRLAQLDCDERQQGADIIGNQVTYSVGRVLIRFADTGGNDNG